MKTKKILAIVALLAAAALICALALAASGGTCGDGLNWTLDDQGTLTITGTGTVSDSPSWTQNWDNVSAITRVRFTGPVTTATDLPATVTDLPAAEAIGTGDYTFGWYENLAEVEFADYPVVIGEGAFSGCANLTRVTIPYRTAVIAPTAFDDCSSDLTIRCRYGSTAWEYAIMKGLRYELILSNIVTLPEDLTVVGVEAFANDPSIDAVRFHRDVTQIADGAFDATVVVIAPAGSYAAQWAQSNGYALIEE